MKLKGLLILCCVLMSSISILAQSAASAADPITGTWKGYMGPGVTAQYPITMQLKFDSKAAVSGTLQGLPSPGEVRVGTFDPNTSVMKLQLGVAGESAVRLVLEGTVVKGTATGSVNGDNQTGTFMITKVAAESMPAQQSNNVNTAAELHKNFSEVADWISKAADMVPAEKYNYKPLDTVRSFGQIVAHVADASNFFCARGAGENVKYSDAIEKGGTDKATLVPKLKQAFEKCEAAYSSSNAQFAPLISNLGHTSLHYGNIITYMRLMGMKPPST